MKRELRLIFIILLIGYHTVPLALFIIPGASSFGMIASIISLLVVNNILAFGAAFYYSINYGWEIWLPALIAALFLPVLLYLDMSAVVYLLMYLVLAILGMILGTFLRPGQTAK